MAGLLHPDYNDEAIISKSLVIKGEVTGLESLYIDGTIEGSINLPNNRVTVGPHGRVAANIYAREIVIRGKVRGDMYASGRIEIRREGSLTGDVVTARISIEDGAFFKGGIDLAKSPQTRRLAIEGSPLAAAYDEAAEQSIKQGLFSTVKDESDIAIKLPKPTLIPASSEFGKSGKFAERLKEAAETY